MTMTMAMAMTMTDDNGDDNDDEDDDSSGGEVMQVTALQPYSFCVLLNGMQIAR
jgi:hypothetical protein